MQVLKTAAAACVLAGLLAPVTALAQEREFCADRPGRATPACTLAPGQAMVEVGALGWDHASDSQSVSDTLTAGDSLLRLGVTQRLELQLGFGGYGHARTRDRATGQIQIDQGAGDVMLAARQGLAGANGPVAVQAFVTLPVGKAPLGAGDWGAGVLLPVTLDLGREWQLGLTPEVDAAVNASGSGRHVAFGNVVALSHPLTKSLSLTGELSAFQDQDPVGHSTDARVTGSLAWQIGKNWQIDVEADVGLSRGAPRHSVMLGLAHRIG